MRTHALLSLSNGCKNLWIDYTLSLKGFKKELCILTLSLCLFLLFLHLILF